MDSTRTEQRQFHALRKHIEQLFSDGWVVVSRVPLRLEHEGQRCIVRHGMLISEVGFPGRLAS
ncbi:hypothetical protein SAMN05216214_10339 [Atopomonas hussainii]|uniref:Uncharacterized protein n=1 Tax=Atopomonas hussainii TaxID=1429083 RepID=A0A1H7HNB0_9GAMM|nr:hypothetical protein [Atopomonas hussainii]SEK51739.1 hypothetical protein SAMN05216214_10339 [Atopomonas hussainii]